MNAKTLPPLRLAAALAASALSAAVVGTNPPSLPLTVERIASLPSAQQPAWRDYLGRSIKQRAADQKLLADERKKSGVKEAPVPPEARGARPMPLNSPAAWYAGDDARRRADHLITFQTPAGGWSKNLNPTDHARAPGEGYSHDNTSRFLASGDHDSPAESHWSYIGTFDNDATISELRFLAKVVTAADEKTSTAWRTSFMRGLDYIIAAQYPNGGWPQVYPLDGGYHDAITFNDGAIVNILTLLHDIADGKSEFIFVPAEPRARAAAAAQRGLRCILQTQIVAAGRRTVWCQQHDMLTLAPTSARNYEMPSQAGGESAGLAIFLMSLRRPTPEVVAAVQAAAAWFEKTALRDVAFRPAPDGSGRALLAAPGAGPTWPRYSQIGTDRPLFGDRDKSIHDHVEEISQERRNGYGWFGDGPKRALDRYATWAKDFPVK
ncbi:MAG: pectate lyase [Opitutus sp.]|nr:pectate lyase [Opitutus sp.]